MNIERHIYEIETLGYTIVKNVFEESVMKDIREKLKITIENDKIKFAQFENKKDELVVDLTIHEPDYLKLMDNDIIHSILNPILGEDTILYSFTSTILKPNTIGGVQDIHVDANKFIPNYISGIVMTIPLEDFTNENGATLYLPGSQNLATFPSEEIFNSNSQSTERSVGDVLFFNPRVYHRAGFNKTNEIRYGITMYATRSFMKQRFDFPNMIPKENLKKLSERTIKFLGFKSKSPSSVEEYYTPINERIRKLLNS